MWETPQLLKSEPIHYSSVIWFWYLTKIDFFSFFPALLLWKEIKQKQIPIVIWKWMSHCSRDSKCIHTQCVHLIIIISNPEQFSQSSLKYFEWFIILKSVSNTRFFFCLFNRGDTTYHGTTPDKGVWPSPYTVAGVIISPTHLYYDFVWVHEFSSR